MSINNDNRSIKGWDSWLAAANQLISDIEEFAEEEYCEFHGLPYKQQMVSKEDHEKFLHLFLNQLIKGLPKKSDNKEE